MCLGEPYADKHTQVNKGQCGSALMDSLSDLSPSHYMSHTTCQRLKQGRNEAHCRQMSPSFKDAYEGGKKALNWINGRLDETANHQNADNVTMHFKFGGSENQLV